MYPSNDYRDYLLHSDEDLKYGLPEKKKYPMPDRAHVMSAIKFFNYVSPSDEKELARNILKRIKEYGIEDINVGDKNRFKKYYKPAYLEHSAKGQKWPKHKYLYITPSGRYVYPSDKQRRGSVRYGRGNIDLTKRPVYVNDDGSISTVESFSVNIDGKEVLLPTITRNKKGKPIKVSYDQAIRNYLKTGKHLGKFDTPEEATNYAISLHNQQDRLYRNSKEKYSYDNAKRLSTRKRLLKSALNRRF